MTDRADVLIVGGGLAGLAAAAELGKRGRRVLLLESRPRLGGRAGSFTDPATGQLVDACQHVGMGCCTALAGFYRECGVAHFLKPEPVLYFVTPDGRVSRFKADPWPAPFHLGRALLRAHYLSPLEKLRIAYGLGRLLLETPDADPPLLPWLLRHKQTPRTIDRFWAVVLVSALNESVGNLGLKYARKVFRDGFVIDRAGYVVEVPTVPLGRLYGDELRGVLASRGVTIRENAGVKQLTGGPGGITGVLLRDGSTMTAAETVLAVPPGRVIDLLPDDLKADPFFAGIPALGASPITSVHLWYDRPPLPLPHAVLVDCLGQWAFSRGETSPGEHYLQVVVSAARQLTGLGREEIERRVTAELAAIFPTARAASVLRAKVVTEHAATFLAAPGVDALRPPQQTPFPGLTLAGDYTRTGWPATMEGAVRSGRLAASFVARHSSFGKNGR